MGPKKFNDSYLKGNGVDPEDVKSDWVGSSGGSYDIYNGDTVTIQSKDGRDVVDTGMTKKEFFDCYGNNEEETR